MSVIPIRLVAPENPFRAALAVGEALLGASGLANVVLFPAKARKLPSAYLVEVSVPGLGKEDVDVEVSGHRLLVTVRRAPRNPFGRSEVRRTFPVPYGVETSGVRASLERGILSITLPMAQSAERSIPVNEPLDP